ncbi:MAG: hypothetical protein ABR954_09265 [Dehalococcoidales bacterium]
MVEIRYGEQYEVTDLAGQTIGEAREHYKSAFGIPDKAKAKLNGSKVKSSAEIDTVLNDDDQVTFAVARSRTPFLIGALLLALAVTGGVFAFGLLNSNLTLSATTNNDFASVTANTDGLSWDVWGNFKGVTTNGSSGPFTIFNITTDAGWGGDLVTTVSLGNVGELAKVYRAFALELQMVDGNSNPINLGLTENNDLVLISLDYPTVNMYVPGSAGHTMYVQVKSGYYVADTGILSRDSEASPIIFCDVTQRN